MRRRQQASFSVSSAVPLCTGSSDLLCLSLHLLVSLRLCFFPLFLFACAVSFALSRHFSISVVAAATADRGEDKGRVQLAAAMGNSESMPRALHDNFLAVSASIKARLGPAAAAGLQEPAAGRSEGSVLYSFGPASEDDNEDYSSRKSASRRKQNDTHTRVGNGRAAGSGAASFSSSSPSPAARRSPATRGSIPRRTAVPQQQVGPSKLVSRKDGAGGGAYSRGRGGGGGGVAAEEAFSNSSYDRTGSNTPAAAGHVPQTNQALPDGLPQRTNGSSTSNRESNGGGGSSRKQQQEGGGRRSSKEESNSRYARGSRRNEERSSASAKVKSSNNNSSRRDLVAGAGEEFSNGDVRRGPSPPVDAAAATSGEAVHSNENDKDAALDWDAPLDFAEEGGDGCVDEEERRRRGPCTRASSVKAASPRLFPSSPTADSWPGAVASPGVAVSPSATSVASSRALSPQKQQQRTAVSRSASQEESRPNVAEKRRTPHQETINHLGSSRIPTRSSSSSSKALDECRLSGTGAAETCRNNVLHGATVDDRDSYVKGRAEGRQAAAEAAEFGRQAAQAERHSESAVDSNSSAPGSLRRRTTAEQSMNAAGSSSDSKEGTDAARPAERWPAAASLEQNSPAAGRAHHPSSGSAREGKTTGRRREGAASVGGGCFSFNSSFEQEKAGRKLPLLLQQEEEETGLSLLSPSYHLDAACTRPATPTTDATTVGGSSSSSAEESWGAGRSSRADAGRKASDGRLSPRRKRGDSSDHAAAPATAKTAAAAGADGPAAAGARSSQASEGGKIGPPAGAARGRRAPGRERSRSKKKIIYGHRRNHFPFLEEPALSHLLPFLFDRSLAACMTVCPHWFMRINSSIERMCSPISKRFAAAYGDYLQLWGAAVKLQPLQTADRDGVRIDWIIFAKVLPAAAGKFIHFGYTYSYAAVPARRLSTLELVRRINSSSNANDTAGSSTRNKSSTRSSSDATATDFPHREGLILSPDGQPCPSMSPRRVYAVSYCLAAGSAGSSRALWIHRDNCRFHGDETGVAAMSSVSPVCVGDFVEVAVSLASGEGRVAVETVDWLPLQQETRRESNPGRRVFTRETCPLEITFSEWFDADTFRHMSTEKVREPENFGPRLRHERTLYSGFDVAVRKSTYRAVAPGSVGGAACRQWGFPCEILPAGVPVVCPLIRRGLQHDRFLSVQMRVGDVVDYYVSQGGTNT